MAADQLPNTLTAGAIRKVHAGLLRSSVRRPPYYLSEDVARATVKMALEFTRSDSSSRCELRRLAEAAKTYVRERAQPYMQFLFFHQGQRASEYLREAHNALAFSLRQLGEREPEWSARSIDLVGYYLYSLPKYYQCDLLDELLSRSDEGVLGWAHLYQLGRLAEFGPPVLEKPQLASWLAKAEGTNAPIYARYLSTFAENRKIWALMKQGITDLADDATDEQMTPLQLERQVSLLLRQTPRGRPRKRIIDLSAPIVLPDVPLY